MAVAAGQSATATAAAGATAAVATTAAVTSAGIVGTAMSAVAATSAVTQATVAMAAAAVVAVASGGMVVAVEQAARASSANATVAIPSYTNTTNTTSIFLQPNTTDFGQFFSGGLLEESRPVCDAELSEYKEGYLELVIQGDARIHVIGNDTWTLESIFEDSYNDVVGGCNGKFERVLHDVSVVSWHPIDAGDAVFATSFWKAIVSCIGCDDVEPLFMSSDCADEVCRRWLAIGDRVDLLSAFTTRYEQGLNEHYGVSPRADETGTGKFVITRASTKTSTAEAFKRLASLCLPPCLVLMEA
jgi:hypothetical protein